MCRTGVCKYGARRMSRLICFDPALTGYVGVAVFSDGLLVDAYSTAVALRNERGPAAWGKVAWAAWLPLTDQGADVVVIEGQQVYPRSSADPNDILQVAGVAGGLASIAVGLGAEVVGPLPAVWKGQAPKGVIKARSVMKLSPLERLAVRAGTTLDGWDAIGVGLHYLKR